MAEPWVDDGSEWCEGGTSALEWGTVSGAWKGSLKRALSSHPAPEEPKSKRKATELAHWSSDTSGGWDAAEWESGDISEQDVADIKQWQGCTSVGAAVPGTNIVPCKTPFEGDLADRAYQQGLIGDADWFGREDLLRIGEEQGTPIGLVIDLVNTMKYYVGFGDGLNGVEYKKVKIPGRQVPDWALIEKCFDLIDDFATRRPGEYVAVHCTHGINRTGYLVAGYLMARCNVATARKAVTRFEKARQSKMDKEYLLLALMEYEQGAW